MQVNKMLLYLMHKWKTIIDEINKTKFKDYLYLK